MLSKIAEHPHVHPDCATSENYFKRERNKTIKIEYLPKPTGT